MKHRAAAARRFVLSVGMSVSVAISLSMPVTTRAASFDCAKARSFSEHAVCQTPTLSALDDALAAAYRKAYAAAKDKRALAADRDEEWRWRQSHCKDASCVTDWYKRRLAELDADYLAAALPFPDETTVSRTSSPTSAPAPAPARQTFVKPGDVSVQRVVRTDSARAPRVVPVAPTQPLPPDSETIGAYDLSSVMLATQRSDGGTSSPQMAPSAAAHWPALPPLPMAAATDEGRFRELKKTDRTADRTVGIYVGF